MNAQEVEAMLKEILPDGVAIVGRYHMGAHYAFELAPGDVPHGVRIMVKRTHGHLIYQRFFSEDIVWMPLVSADDVWMAVLVTAAFDAMLDRDMRINGGDGDD